MMIGLNLAITNTGFGRGVLRETSLLVARMSSRPSSSRIYLIDRLYRNAKRAGWLSKLDGVYVEAAHDAQGSRLNWVADQYNLTEVSSPTFTVDAGYQGDGVASYLETGFNPATATTPHFVQDSASMGAWSATDLDRSGASSWEMGNSRSTFERNAANLMTIRPNTLASVGGGSLTPSQYPGLFGWTRSSASSWAAYKDGAQVATGSDASAAVASQSFRVLAATGLSFGTNQHRATFFGGALTSDDWASIYAALDEYFAGVDTLEAFGGEFSGDTFV